MVKMEQNDPYYNTTAAYYFAGDNKIHINHEMLDEMPYGCRRSILSHECVHNKYEDQNPTPKCEHRADVEGFNATKCFMCVHEMASTIEENGGKSNGYLTPKDIDKIALDLKKQNKICSYHQMNQTKKFA